jgi:hypothetical protein
LILTLPEGVAEIVSRIALLFGERTGLGIAQHVRKMHKPGVDLSAIDLSMRKRHQSLVIRPLITNKRTRPFAGRERGHLQSFSIVE